MKVVESGVIKPCLEGRADETVRFAHRQQPISIQRQVVDLIWREELADANPNERSIFLVGARIEDDGGLESHSLDLSRLQEVGKCPFDEKIGSGSKWPL